MDRDELFAKVVRLRQEVEKEPCATSEERHSRKVIAAALHALSAAIFYNSELELDKHISQFLYEELKRASEADDNDTSRG